MARSGKIARLPRHLREQLNHRLDDGEPGPQLLAWLNNHAVAKEILERDFGGRTISEQNLSEWRQGGFRDWQRQQEACEHVRRLTDQSEALAEAAEETNVSDRLAGVFGGGEQGRKMASMITKIKFDLPLEDDPPKAEPAQTQTDVAASAAASHQALQSNGNQSNQGKSR